MTRRLAWRHLTGPIVGVALLAAGPASADASAPSIDASAVHLTGGLPDGTVASGASVEVQIDPGAITGDPAPAVKITWRTIDQTAGGDVVAESDTPHVGPITTPAPKTGEEIQITATVTATNSDGVATAAAPTLAVRSAPYMTNGCCGFNPSVPRPLHVKVGQRIEVTALELGTRLGLPSVTAGDPAPQVTMHWLRCRNRRCSLIARATRSSYTAERRDVGYSLRIRLTARNPLGSYSLDLVTPGRLAVRTTATPKHGRSRRP
jgi:hypothetical protein